MHGTKLLREIAQCDTAIGRILHTVQTRETDSEMDFELDIPAERPLTEIYPDYDRP